MTPPTTASLVPLPLMVVETALAVPDFMRHTAVVGRRRAPGRQPGPAGGEGRPHDQPVPSLGAFLRSRFISANGIVAALYLLLSLWIYLNPERARAIWKRLQGH